mgnify:CR=1 FL=1
MPDAQQGAKHGQTNGSGHVANKLGSALALVRALRTLLQGLGAASEVIEGATPGLLHFVEERPLLGPVFVGHAVAKRIGGNVALVDQLLALFVRKLGSHGFASLAVSVAAGLA